MNNQSLTLNINPYTEAQAERKHELEYKLSQEEEKYEQSMLGSFDHRLSKLENFIMPIHRSTQKLTKMHYNIDIALAQISSYTSTFDVIQQHEAIVTKGPQGKELAVYLASIGKLKESLNHLESIKFKSSDRKIQALKDTLWKGIRQLDEIFGVVLQAASDGIEPSAYSTDGQMHSQHIL
eukprot:jgi/Hompol1/627/HPOL_005375-RA